MPAYALANVQEGIARSYDWVGLAMMPGYVVRQLLLTVIMGAAYFAQLPMNAVTAMIVAGTSIWLPTLWPAPGCQSPACKAHRARTEGLRFQDVGCSPRCPS